MTRWTGQDLKAVQKRLPRRPLAARTALPVDSTVAVDPSVPSAPLLRLKNVPKYKNVPTGRYASIKEAKRAGELGLLQQAGQITELEAQVRYELIPKQDGERACSYIADFRYRDVDGALVVEDTKGYRTPGYRIKRKLMLFIHGIAIRET